MSAAQHTRPSRTYKDGIGKPVVAKRWDDVIRAHRWDVVFPPCNNFGGWPVEPEAIMVGKAQRWCFAQNDMLRAHEGTKATGEAS